MRWNEESLWRCNLGDSSEKRRISWGEGGGFRGEARWKRERVAGVYQENIGKNLRDIG